jgi:hypothetical protein
LVLQVDYFSDFPNNPKRPQNVEMKSRLTPPAAGGGATSASQQSQVRYNHPSPIATLMDPGD